MPVVVLVADGARPDTFASALTDGRMPALARLRDEGGLYTVTSVFPSVTGPAYTPFLMGRHPASVGLPGLRWFDRSHTVGWPTYARSYVGPDMRHLDDDLRPDAPTLFELAPNSVGALSVVRRGLPRRNRIGRGAAFIARTALTHFRGDVRGWLDIDRDIGDEVVRRIHDDRPDFVFAAFTGVDKTSHAAGHESPLVRDALSIVDDVARQIRTDAQQAGQWAATHLWIVSDHGHSSVTRHEDLAGLMQRWGMRPLAHPFVFTRDPQIGVMVSGNAMAHLYLQMDRRRRPFWPELRGDTHRYAGGVLVESWGLVADKLLVRESVDLMLLPMSPTACEILARGRGRAMLTWANDRYSYTRVTGDPLGIGDICGVDAAGAYDATMASDYPDALVQIARLAESPRSGEIILSAARGWDFRAKYEPIPHLSAHGALHRDHMLVPLLLNHAAQTAPQRTVDVMPSALRALGLAIPPGLDGIAFT